MKNIDRLTWLILYIMLISMLILYIMLISILYAVYTLSAPTKEPKYFILEASEYYPGPEHPYLYAIYTLPAPVKEIKYFILEATGYYPGPECTYPFDDGFTAIGDIAGRGSVAIDDKKGPLCMGQKVWVENYGFGKCNDRGSAIKGWKIDLCFETYEEAVEWGRKLIKVYVLE